MVFFVGYLMLLPISRPYSVRCRMTNDALERIWKEATPDLTGVLFQNLLVGTEGNHNQYQDTRCPGRDSTRAPLEYKSTALPLDFIFQLLLFNDAVSIDILQRRQAILFSHQSFSTLKLAIETVVK
jgi:hypothetical protein